MLRRHQGLTLGNVFARRCADGLPLTELQKLISEGNNKLLNKLLYFGSLIPGTSQYMRFKSDQAISFVKFIRITSDDTAMFNFFQTFSAADTHWEDFHRLLPGSEKYLNKRVVTPAVYAGLTEEEKQGCITNTEDHLLIR